MMVMGSAVQTIAFEIVPSVRPIWRVLPRCVRWHVTAFPDLSAAAETYGTPRFVDSLNRPSTDVAPINVAVAAAHLSTAFPRLVRRVTGVVVDGPITVLLECEGLHEGMWGGIICPTRRRVAFEEHHAIVAVDGRIVSDRVTLDLSGIVQQLCGDDRIDPDETARMGKQRRELHERARAAALRFARETPRE
jgi:hypothetical protein